MARKVVKNDVLSLLDPTDIVVGTGHPSVGASGVRASKRISKAKREETKTDLEVGSDVPHCIKRGRKYGRKGKKELIKTADGQIYDPTFYNPMYPREMDLHVRDIPVSEIPPPFREKALEENWTVSKVNTEIRRAYAAYFTGSVPQTLNLMEEDGWGPWLPPRETARGWLWLPEVRAILETRLYNVPGYKKGIATREELQIFWTKVIRDEKEETKIRLEASKYLAQSHAMFIERKELGLTVTLKDLLKEVETIAEAKVVDTAVAIEGEE